MLHTNGRNIMNKIVLKINDNDNFSVENSTEINLLNKNDYHHTFYESLRSLFKLPNFFQKEALDLFYISLIVYYADRTISRKSTFDSWTRSFHIYVPVLELDKWKQNKKILEKLVSYLSGDIWSFEFRKRELNDLENKVMQNILTKYKSSKYNFTSFCMLSGGLDSYIGSIDLLELDKEIAFVGHYGGGKGVKQYQDKIIETLKNEYKIPKTNFFNYHAAPLKGVEDTTRTRSFMFFAHAIILASTFKKDINLYIPENGLISLNIPLTNTRLGSSSTRTTHPFYMKNLQLLLDNLGLQVKLKNPYQFKTKGEMIEECKNQKLLNQTYNQTMSCSHPDHVRYKGEHKPKHCGTCLPCVIRRASVLYAYANDTTNYFDLNFSNGKSKDELRSFKIGLLDYERRKTNKFIIQLSGKIEDRVDEYFELYKRGMAELKKLLDSINE